MPEGLGFHPENSLGCWFVSEMESARIGALIKIHLLPENIEYMFLIHMYRYTKLIVRNVPFMRFIKADDQLCSSASGAAPHANTQPVPGRDLF